MKDAWAYDEEDEEDDALTAMDSSELGSEDAGASSRGGLGTLGRRSRKSLLESVTSGSIRESKRKGESGVEKKANCSKVGLELDISQGAQGSLEVSLAITSLDMDDVADRTSGRPRGQVQVQSGRRA